MIAWPCTWMRLRRSCSQSRHQLLLLLKVSCKMAIYIRTLFYLETEAQSSYLFNQARGIFLQSHFNKLWYNNVWIYVLKIRQNHISTFNPISMYIKELQVYFAVRKYRTNISTGCFVKTFMITIQTYIYYSFLLFGIICRFHPRMPCLCYPRRYKHQPKGLNLKHTAYKKKPW